MGITVTADKARRWRHHPGKIAYLLTLAALLGVLQTSDALPAVAASPSAPSPVPMRASTLEGNSSDAARREAIRSIPLEKLSAKDRVKVSAVCANVSLFRRMPIRVIDCDPDMYLFLVRHPDVVVNIWDVFKISKLQLRQSGENRFRVAEPDGASASLEFLYSSHDLHVIYGEGTYEGPILSRPVTGRGLLILKSGYVRETNGRYYVTSRMDCLLTVEPVGAEILTKTISPLVSKTVDNNFVQTLAFLRSLSHTAETNTRGVQRLATQLEHVQPEVRAQFTGLVANAGRKAPPADEEDNARTEIARRPTESRQR